MSARAPDGIVRRIFANLARLIGGKAGAGLFSLGYMVIAARELGPADYGVLMLVHAFAMTVGGIVEFPGWHAIVRYGAEALEAKDHDRLGRLLRFAGAVELAGGVAAVLTAALLGPLLGARLGWSPVAVAFALPYSLAVLASIRATPSGFLQLTGRYGLLGFHTMAAPAVRLVGALVAGLSATGLHGFLVAWLIAALVEWASLWVIGLWAARRQLGSLPLLGSLKGVTQENEGIWRFMIGANADVTFGELAGRVPPLLIGATLGAAPVGLYSLAQRVTNVLTVPAQVLGTAAYAELARLVASGGHGAPLRAALRQSLGIAVLASVPVVLILILFGKAIVVAVGGAGFAGAAGLLLWLTLARAIMLAGPPTSAALVALGRPELSVTANLGSALVTLPLLFLLLSRFGTLGAGWHAVVQAVFGVGLLLVFVRRESRRRERDTSG